LARLRLPLRASPQQSCAPKTQATWLQFCPACLAEDETPYFRRSWSLATRVSCFRHGCRLRDRCPSCGQGLAPFSQKRLVPHQICALCGTALCKRTRPATNRVRRLERLIDDLLRLHAVGYRMSEGRSLPDLLGSACFQFGRRPMSIARLPHRDRYHLFRQLTEGRSTPFGTRRNPAIAYWRRAAQAAPAWRGLVTSFSDAVLPRPKAGPYPTTAGPYLADLIQAAARLHQKRQAF
ncbi:TniQ family protein, partial [Sulfitobacter pseudonitzschiae]|nr:TniQ family protein [Pseudosulfitobacter pseudonitzschiae]MBM1835148.1 TniQ family protein [Pseudosulfitobacter pseudonitzschiae]MBM1840021.1 TniQ family protein [Pseudosulfitobacter pseudonitzschiae]MBM1844884.1 TniQ family protein [Pseudosulfitobacter pseudonitzschiae]MBM1849718.1 TniQ family protein [Pseudosulfitobacter pseudonitzschiae]